MTLFRAKVYQTFKLGNKPAVRWPIAYGPWVTEQTRAQNLVKSLNHYYHDVWLQRAKYKEA